MKYYYLILQVRKERTGSTKGFLKVTAVVAFLTLLHSAHNLQMNLSWNVYTCQMSINRDRQHISSTDCVQNSC